jgi:hypothetical protein
MKIWYFFLALMSTSCASVSVPTNGVLYKSYIDYKAAVVSMNESSLSAAISKRYLKAMNEAAKDIPDELGLDMPLWRDLAKEISAEHSHVEKIDEGTGCLTVNGLDKFDRPRSLSFYYIKEDGYWVFDNVMVTAHDTIRDYYTEPTCPSFE